MGPEVAEDAGHREHIGDNEGQDQDAEPPIVQSHLLAEARSEGAFFGGAHLIGRPQGRQKDRDERDKEQEVGSREAERDDDPKQDAKADQGRVAGTPYAVEEIEDEIERPEEAAREDAVLGVDESMAEKGRGGADQDRGNQRQRS